MIDLGPPPLWVPPRPAIIRPANDLVKANFLPGMFPAGFVAPGGLQLVNLGVGEANATSFSLNPSSLGAATGDVMVVASGWETDSAVTTPSGWTNHIDIETPLTGVSGRTNLDSRVMPGTVPGSTSWTYGGSNGVAFAWIIFRGATGVGNTATTEDETGSTGLSQTSLNVGAGVLAVVLFAVVDGNSETGETAAFSNVEAEANSGSGHIAGRYGMVGYRVESGTVSFTTTSFTRNLFQQVAAEIV